MTSIRGEMFPEINNIYFLQDTHFSEKDEMLIQSQWGTKSLFNSSRTNSRGVAILLNNNFECKVHNIDKDDSGYYMYLILDTTVENMTRQIYMYMAKFRYNKFLLRFKE